ncbi:hypothetical protein FN846DRAFT_906401 [Sphaerosporella brunnea]|uniref:Uncharacterized protein n=1 Tax=Sphaerosporella brunnea TaxID=1250544 RepID=A0A5J5EYU5_9PEZI|nr:hypothetical protein FN846DRAFT_906401 [Sphaerosporella brunnea]
MTSASHKNSGEPLKLALGNSQHTSHRKLYQTWNEAASKPHTARIERDAARTTIAAAQQQAQALTTPLNHVLEIAAAQAGEKSKGGERHSMDAAVRPRKRRIDDLVNAGEEASTLSNSFRAKKIKIRGSPIAHQEPEKSPKATAADSDKAAHTGLRLEMTPNQRDSALNAFSPTNPSHRPAP